MPITACNPVFGDFYDRIHGYRSVELNDEDVSAAVELAEAGCATYANEDQRTIAMNPIFQRYVGRALLTLEFPTGQCGTPPTTDGTIYNRKSGYMLANWEYKEEQQGQSGTHTFLLMPAWSFIFLLALLVLPALAEPSL